MKINKKIIVSSMALCMGAALAGSVSGTIAWYQYSTRSTVALTGASVGASENLQVRLGTAGTWKSDLRLADVKAWLEDTSANKQNANSTGSLKPITAGELAENGKINKFYAQPVYQQADYSTWGEAAATDYISLPIYVRAVKNVGETDVSYLAKNIYIHNVAIADVTVAGKSNITSAVRVTVEGKDADAQNVYANFSADGTDVNVYGKLNLNNEFDKDGNPVYDQTGHYEWETRTDITYGADQKVSKTYTAGEYDSSNAKKAVYYGDADDGNGAGTNASALVVGKTTEGSEDGCLITVKVWLEGWKQLGAQGKESALWDVSDFDGSKFNVGITFACER